MGRTSVGSVIKTVFSVIGKTLATIFLILIITGCIVASVIAIYILNMVNQDEIIDISQIKLNYTTIIYANDKHTGEDYELQRVYGDVNSIWVDLEDIPEDLKNAFIAVEDERFEEHSGVDWKSTFASALNYFVPFMGRNRGGSTITQQLIKNVTGENEVRIERKVQEIFRALNLEKVYSKDDILEAYLNIIHLGNNTNGVQAAANLYFDKDVDELSILECAAIAGMTQNPVAYDPFRNTEKNRERLEYVLDKMLETEKITKYEYNEAKSQELDIALRETGSDASSVYSWFEENVIEEVVSDLMEKEGYSRSYAEYQFFNKGYRIYTTLDEDVQNHLEDKYSDPATFPEIKNSRYPQSAVVVQDLNGKILGLVGSRTEKTENRLYNRATMAKRQPGSTIKPISVYGLGIEHNLIHWSTLIEDSPLTVNAATGKGYPVNYYGRYDGYMTTDEAIRRSVNTVAMKVCEMLTPRICFDFLKSKLSMNSLVESKVINEKVFSDIDLAPMSLGGLTDGVTVNELTGAYQIFANGGTFTKPYSYTRVEDADGNIILENTGEKTRVISEETATIMNKLLQRVVNAQGGTGTAAKIPNMPTAGKTGTSTADVDQWFVGMTPYYVAAVWLGYDKPAQISYYQYPPPIIWKNVMAGLHEGLETIPFYESPNVISYRYCTLTGLLATDACTTTDIGYYKTNNVPKYCTNHQEIVGTEDDFIGGDIEGDIEGDVNTDNDVTNDNNTNNDVGGFGTVDPPIVNEQVIIG